MKVPDEAHQLIHHYDTLDHYAFRDVRRTAEAIGDLASPSGWTYRIIRSGAMAKPEPTIAATDYVCVRPNIDPRFAEPYEYAYWNKRAKRWIQGAPEARPNDQGGVDLYCRLYGNKIGSITNMHTGGGE